MELCIGDDDDGETIDGIADSFDAGEFSNDSAVVGCIGAVEGDDEGDTTEVGNNGVVGEDNTEAAVIGNSDATV
jgi:hypothetical protein